MRLVASESLPINVSERQACDVLNVCRNSVRAARRLLLLQATAAHTDVRTGPCSPRP